MTNNVTINEWTGDISSSAEATAADGRFLSLFVAPLPGCAWGPMGLHSRHEDGRRRR